MADREICCRELASGQNLPSPFARIVAFGYYDGPTAGLAQCRRCDQVYRFEMLAWEDEVHEIRAFSLAPVPDFIMTQLVTSLSPYEAPCWPIWVPRWQFPSEAVQEAMDREVEQILQRAKAPEYVIATTDISRQILASKAATQEDVRQVTDWFAFLDLQVRPAEYVP